MASSSDNKKKKASGLESDTSRIVARYLLQLRSITIIRQLIPVVAATQQHRGATLALLEGDDSFSDKVRVLQKEIDSRFRTLRLLNRELSEPVPVNEIEVLLLEWQSVYEWSDGSPLENFNLHSHFIEQQMKLIWSIAERTNCFLLAAAPMGVQKDVMQNARKDLLAGDTLLVQFILDETPELMELLARVRGLATHACVIGNCDIEHTSWLDYLLKQLNQKKERFRVLSKSLQRYALRDVPALIDMQIQDVRIVQLVQLVENNILHKKTTSIDSHNIFTMATNIINSQTEIVRQGLDFIQNKIHRQMDGWHFECG